MKYHAVITMTSAEDESTFCIIRKGNGMLKLLIVVLLMLTQVALSQEGKPAGLPGEVPTYLASSVGWKISDGGISSGVVRSDVFVSVTEDAPVINRRPNISGVISNDLFESERGQDLVDSLAGVKTKDALKAGFFSLVIPGAGQLSNGNFIKSAAFFGVELAGWIVNLVYNQKGANATEAFQLYADGTAADNYQNGHYSVVRYAEWIQKNLTELMIQQGTSPANQTIAKEYAPLMVVNNGKPAPWDQINWYALNQVEVSIGGYFSHWLFVYPNVEYYKEIGKYPQFRQGWIDENPSILTYDAIRIDTPDSYFYENMRGTATHLYNVALFSAGVLILNHFASAAEAAIWAHNNYKPVKTSIGVSALPQGVGYQAVFNLAVNF